VEQAGKSCKKTRRSFFFSGKRKSVLLALLNNGLRKNLRRNQSRYAHWGDFTDWIATGANFLPLDKLLSLYNTPRAVPFFGRKCLREMTFCARAGRFKKPLVLT